MRPVDPRLFRESRHARRWLTTVIAGGLGSAACTIGAAMLLSDILARAVEGHVTIGSVTIPLLIVAAVAICRAVAMWVAEYSGHRGARQVITSLRRRLMWSLAQRGPAALADQRTGTLVTDATSGVEALDVYFARYLPQLVLGTAVPVMVLLYLSLNDLLSAVIVLITLPLIPLFMWLIGSTAQHRIDRRWQLLHRLGAYYLDVIQGLPTLRIFNRADVQIARVRDITEASRRATMGTLSIAFLSALVLEVLASIATALVAAEIGLRLVEGTMTLQVGLAVLIVVPEAYLPLRQLGTFFHASMEGLTAAGSILDLTDENAQCTDDRPRLHVTVATSTVTVSDLTYRHGERGEGLRVPLNFSLLPGATAIVTGASGTGKTTLLDLLLGFHKPDTGAIRIGGVDINHLDINTYRSQLAWVPQAPALFPGSLLDNLRLGAADVSREEARSLIERLFPDGHVVLETPLTPDGEGMSGGERVRLALARAVLRRPALMLLDEPTAFLDPTSTATVVELLRELSETTTLVIATHDPALFPWATQIFSLDDRAVAPEARAG